MNDTALLSLIIFLPTLAAAVIMLPWIGKELVKAIAVAATLATCVLSLMLLNQFLKVHKADVGNVPFASRVAAAQPDNQEDLIVRKPWISVPVGGTEFTIEYFLGVDGMSLSLVVLTGIVSFLACLASLNIEKFTRGYFILFLLLETGMMGVFLSLDLFLFYVFWEVMLLPMYFLIGIWGGPRREYAAIKFFLYTLLGSVLILIAMIAFYFTSKPNTFDIIALQQIGQRTQDPLFSVSFQVTMFVLLFIGFAVKVPIVPLHTWLPDAHVEAPTPISMILAGVLLKMGGYGLLRIAYPICPAGAYILAFPVAVIAVVSIIYGALAAMAQNDFKKLVAYSSVSHMGYVTLGIAVMPVLDAASYSWGLNGAMFQMIAHGISSTGMFFLVGVIYERAHHRDLNKFGGLMNIMPYYGAFSVVIFFAGMGLPGLCGFIGEVATVLAGFKYHPAIGIISALGVVLTAGYILWAMQRVYFGTNPKYDGTPDVRWLEVVTIMPLILLALLLGMYPNSLLSWMGPDVAQLSSDLTKYAIEFSKTATDLAAK